MIDKTRLINIHKTVENYLLDIEAIQKFPLDRPEINEQVSTDLRGLYVIYDNGTPIYVGQAGASSKIDNTSIYRLNKRLNQYLGSDPEPPKDPNEKPYRSATQNVRNYLKGKPIKMTDLEFSFLVIQECDIILIAEQIAISILRNSYKDKLINK